MANIQTDATLFYEKKLLKVKSKTVINTDSPNIPPEPLIKRYSGPHGKYVEEPWIDMEELEYSRPGIDQGIVIIFNHETFLSKNLGERKGSIKDVEELKITLDRLKFNIEEQFIYKDLTAEEIKAAIDNSRVFVSIYKDQNEQVYKFAVSDMNLEDRNSLICIFMSHGRKDNQLAVKNGTIEVEVIYEKLAKHKDLKGRPKLFIFQACKNDPQKKIKKQTKYSEIESQLVCERTLKLDIPDVMLVYSTLEGEVSMRHSLYGTWFIQELCRTFTAYGRRDDVSSLMIRTTNCVANNYSFKGRVKQLPIFISTMTKKFYLTRNKDRVLMFQMKEKIKSLEKKQKFLAEVLQKQNVI